MARKEKKVVARKVEVKLNKRVKKLVYDYITKGAFGNFLGAVNNDYQRYNDQRQREEDLAATFINQVLRRRKKNKRLRGIRGTSKDGKA